jgi:hypothetical protein
LLRLLPADRCNRYLKLDGLGPCVPTLGLRVPSLRVVPRGRSIRALRQVVKAFSAEKYELGRYREAAARQQLAGRKGQTSMVSLRVVQSLIMRVAMCGVLFTSALEVINGTSSVGDFVAIQVWSSYASSGLVMV